MKYTELPTECRSSLTHTIPRQVYLLLGILLVGTIIGTFCFIWFSVSPMERVWYSRVLLSVLVLGGSAGVLWLTNRARQAAIVRDTNDRPLTLGQVNRQPPYLLAYSLQRHYDNLDVWAAHSTYRNLHSLSTNYSNRQDARHEASDQQCEIPTVLPINPSTPLLPQLEERGLITRDKLLVGFADQQPQQFQLKLTGFVGLAGKQGSGKTTTALLALAQAAQHNWRVILCDKHGEQDEGLIKRVQPWSGCLIRQAIEIPDIIAAIQWYMQLADNRIHKRVPIDTRILLVIDEFTSMVLRRELPDDLLEQLTAAATEYRKVECHGLIIGHQWSHRSLGASGAMLRRALTHSIVHRIAEDDAELLLPRGSYQVETLQPGHAIVDNGGDIQRVQVPALTAKDRQLSIGSQTPLTQGMTQISTPASYQIGQISPTVRAAPATLQLAPLTVAEEIVTLLHHRDQPISAHEIADHIGKNAAHIRKELTHLVKTNQVKRSGDVRSYRYELHVHHCS
ncbi:MAG: hypothetical protein AAGF95_26320 [Chloroflexota bacterium]